MSYSTAQIMIAIATAKCCLGDYTCKMFSKVINGQIYEASKLVSMQLSLLIFALETENTISTGECLTDDQKYQIVNRINKLCQCDCTSVSSGGSGTGTGVHTSSSHTDLTHTE